MAEFASRRVREAFDALASRQERAAAGVACAMTGAMAAGLVELSSELAAGRLSGEGGGDDQVKRMREISGRCAELREQLTTVADEDVAVYGEVAGAAEAARDDALSRASDPPLRVAEAAGEIAVAAAETVDAGDWPFTADARVAGGLAASAARGAAELVAANLGELPDDPRTDRARAAAERAARASRLATDAAPG